MNDIHVPQTTSTPAVDTDWQRGVVTMVGDSYPENPFDFFQPLIDWIEAFLSTTAAQLHLDLQLIYLNTSSVRAMMDIFDRLDKEFADGRAVSVRWSYGPGNERVAELADEFKEDCRFPFAIGPQV